MTKEELMKLRKNLPKGAKQNIADKLGITKETVAHVLLGNRNNEQVIIEAVALVAEHKRIFKEAQTYIQEEL
jgi:hypothetical protein